MSKKVMIICGSPRKKGNTMTLVNWVKTGAEEAGAKVELVDAARLDYKTNGCIACYGCQKSDDFKCVIKDDAADILARMHEQEVIVFASPVYFMGVTAQLKLLFDRMFSLVKICSDGTFKHCLQKPKFGLIATAGGDENSGLNLTIENIKAATEFYGKNLEVFSLPLAPMNPEDLLSNSALKEKTLNFGKKLVE